MITGLYFATGLYGSIYRYGERTGAGAGPPDPEENSRRDEVRQNDENSMISSLSLRLNVIGCVQGFTSQVRIRPPLGRRRPATWQHAACGGVDLLRRICRGFNFIHREYDFSQFFFQRLEMTSSCLSEQVWCYGQAWLADLEMSSGWVFSEMANSELPMCYVWRGKGKMGICQPNHPYRRWTRGGFAPRI